MIDIRKTIDVDSLTRQEEIKWILIGGEYGAIAFDRLKADPEFRRLPLQQQAVDRSQLASLYTRHTTDYVTKEFIDGFPVVFMETLDADEVYALLDGTHRVVGAIKLGLRSVSCIGVPRSLWLRYLVSEKVYVNFEFGGIGSDYIRRLYRQKRKIASNGHKKKHDSFEWWKF